MNNSILKSISVTGLFALTAIAAASCSTTTNGATETTQHEILTGVSGGILVSLEPSQSLNCTAYMLEFMNVQTGEKFRGASRIGDIHKPEFANVVAVPPGRYLLNRGVCQLPGHMGLNSSFTLNLAGIDRAFGTVDVHPGEVVYPGTVIPFSKNDSRTYGGDTKFYTVADRFRTKAAGLARKNPALQARLKVRPLPKR